MSGGASRRVLEGLLAEGLSAVEPRRCVARVIRRRGDRAEIAGVALPPESGVHGLAIGKAALPMMAALADLPEWRGGLAVTPRHDSPASQRATFPDLVVEESSHPVPDETSARAGRAVRDFTAAVPRQDFLLVLLSGGASSLLAEPLSGLALEEGRAATEWLLASGLEIAAQNTVRKHLFACAGGRLAAARRGGGILVLGISDVMNDDWSVLGSGPFAPDRTTAADALACIARGARPNAFPSGARAFLEAGHRGERPGTLPPGHPSFRNVQHRLVASNGMAREAMRDAARRQGLEASVQSQAFSGEAALLGKRFAAVGRSLARGQVTIAGGESTVRLEGDPAERGHGGRNQELALAAALELDGERGVSLLAAGSDGVDGPTDAAGAFSDGSSCEIARQRGRDPRRDLERHDSHGFFEAAGGLLRTGPTGTNVADFVLVAAARAG